MSQARKAITVLGLLLPKPPSFIHNFDMPILGQVGRLRLFHVAEWRFRAKARAASPLVLAIAVSTAVDNQDGSRIEPGG
jgi:hypothetical protein